MATNVVWLWYLTGEMTTSALLGPPIESDDEDAAQEFEPDDDDENDNDIEDDDEDEDDDDEGKAFSCNGW